MKRNIVKLTLLLWPTVALWPAAAQAKAPSNSQPELVPLVQVEDSTTELQARQVDLGDKADKKKSPKNARLSFQQQLRQKTWSLGIDSAADLAGAGISPMASTRLDVAYQLPLPMGTVASFGLRSGYSLRIFKGPTYDPMLGSDANAILALHSIPLLATAAMSYCSGQPLVFGLPARSSLYAGLGGNLIFGQAQSFGRSLQVMSFRPSYLLGASFEIQHSPALHYGLFAEWEKSEADLKDLPGLSTDMSALRMGFKLAFAFGEGSGGSDE